MPSIKRSKEPFIEYLEVRWRFFKRMSKVMKITCITMLVFIYKLLSPEHP